MQINLTMGLTFCYTMYIIKNKGENMKSLKKQLSELGSIAELSEVIAYAQECKVMLAKASISVGAKVYVVQKTKKTLGVVEKINTKKAIVKLPQGKYNVPLSMLEAA